MSALCSKQKSLLNLHIYDGRRFPISITSHWMLVGNAIIQCRLHHILIAVWQSGGVGWPAGYCWGVWPALSYLWVMTWCLWIIQEKNCALNLIHIMFAVSHSLWAPFGSCPIILRGSTSPATMCSTGVCLCHCTDVSVSLTCRCICWCHCFVQACFNRTLCGVFVNVYLHSQNLSMI